MGKTEFKNTNRKIVTMWADVMEKAIEKALEEKSQQFLAEQLRIWLPENIPGEDRTPEHNIYLKQFKQIMKAEIDAIKATDPAMSQGEEQKIFQAISSVYDVAVSSVRSTLVSDGKISFSCSRLKEVIHLLGVICTDITEELSNRHQKNQATLFFEAPLHAVTTLDIPKLEKQRLVLQQLQQDTPSLPCKDTHKTKQYQQAYQTINKILKEFTCFIHETRFDQSTFFKSAACLQKASKLFRQVINPELEEEDSVLTAQEVDVPGQATCLLNRIH
jgi:hypothetical protein